MLPLLVLAFGPSPLWAQPVQLDLFALRRAAEAPYLARAPFFDLLRNATGVLEAVSPTANPALAANDPYYWALQTRFGGALEGSTVAGGILACARYGLETRDGMATAAMSDEGSFVLMQQALILSDDAAAWPEGAVARLVCALTWDDARRVALISETEVLAALTGFDEVESFPDPRANAPTRVFGPGGYRIVGRAGPMDAVVMLDGIWVDQLATHHQVRFRSFLMGGGS